MKRILTTAILVLFAAAIPAGAMATKSAKSQCRAEYNEAKRAAGKLKTHKERVDGKRDAKKKYEECLENAKHKS